MSLDTLMDQTVTIVRFPDDGESRYNDPEGGTPVEVVHRCRLEQTSSSEITEGRDTVISDWILFLPNDADIQPTDQVVIDGRNFEVVGAPVDARSRGLVDHIEARLRFVKA